MGSKTRTNECASISVVGKGFSMTDHGVFVDHAEIFRITNYRHTSTVARSFALRGLFLLSTQTEFNLCIIRDLEN